MAQGYAYPEVEPIPNAPDEYLRYFREPLEHFLRSTALITRQQALIAQAARGLIHKDALFSVEVDIQDNVAKNTKALNEYRQWLGQNRMGLYVHTPEGQHCTAQQIEHVTDTLGQYTVSFVLPRPGMDMSPTTLPLAEVQLEIGRIKR